MFQIEGEKEFLLFPPADYPNLYYTGRPKGKLRYEYPGNFTRDARTLDKRSYLFASSVHIDSPDYVKHPLYHRATPVRAHLRPGDVLFVPAYWHHEVQSVPSPDQPGDGPGTGGMNIAMNVWFANLSFPDVPGML